MSTYEDKNGQYEDTIGEIATTPKAIDLAEGTRIHRYLIIRLIGKGGMGAVYQAYDPELDRRIAIKMLTVSPQADETASVPHARLMREAQALAKLNHPNVISVFDVGTHQDCVYIAMEYVAGKTLRDWLGETNPTRQEIIEVFLAAGKGLQAAHAEGIIHRDFKPENLLVGENGQVKVLDFGLARAAGSEKLGPAPEAMEAMQSPIDSTASERLLTTPLTQVGAWIGTPLYMAPEHFTQGELDHHTDQFSFCVSLFEALYGQRPFSARNIRELGENISEGRLVIPEDNSVPGWMSQIVIKGSGRSADQCR